MKLNKLTLKTKFNIFILTTLALAMGLMLYLSLYFYKKHFEEEVHEDFKVIISAIVNSKLYTIKDMQKLKTELLEKERWRFSPYRRVLDDANILITETKPTDIEDDIHLSVKYHETPWITLSTKGEEHLEEYKHLMHTLLIVMFSLLLVAGVIILWGVTTLVKPIASLTQLCHDMQAQKPSIALCNPNSLEVYELYTAVTSLLTKNRHLCESKVDLFKEAAHELKAPLAIMQARLNLLQEDKNYNLDKYEAETKHDIKVMNSKLKELLFLKEIESDMQQGATEEICMMEQCKSMQEQFKRLTQLKKITIETNWEKSFQVLAHTRVLRKVMQVIFENVFLHSKPNSTIKVKVSTDEKQMIITNEVNSEGSEHVSSHIGLKIIDRLAEKLHYEFSTKEENGFFITRIKFNS